MNLEIVWTGRFKKDYKKAMKQGLPIEKVDMVIRLLASCVELPKEYKDHLLLGPCLLYTSDAADETLWV